MTSEHLAKLIRRRCGECRNLDEIVGTYKELCDYVGVDSDNPPVGLDLVEMSIARYGEERERDVERE